jgi:hypothetical protein
VKIENNENWRRVLKSPKIKILVKFSKNFLLFMLYPDAKMIGGKQK